MEETAENIGADVRIMRAAVRLFARNGFQAVGIRELAKEAGLSSAALYHYMGTKNDLLFQIMMEALQAWYEVTLAACEAETGAPEKLCAFVRSHVISSGRFPLESVVIDTEIRSLKGDQRSNVVALRDQYEGLLDRIIQQGIEEGNFSTGDPKLVSLGLLEMCNGLSRWYRPEGRSTLEDIADGFADIALAAVNAKRDGVPLRLNSLKVKPASNINHQVSERASRVAFLAHTGKAEK
ncbi:MAG: TetR family transcriptional regulator [Rhizobiaceae bacterium]|nr:TetR family transcriptional regulator [Rhizobiaceae bacterium]